MTRKSLLIVMISTLVKLLNLLLIGKLIIRQNRVVNPGLSFIDKHVGSLLLRSCGTQFLKSDGNWTL